jgi:hypothetical protein
MKHSILRYLHILAVGTTLAVLVAASSQLQAQTTASLSGTIQDSTGAVAGAHVTLTNTVTNEIRALDSNSSGYFSFAGIVPGTYKVNITANGFRGFEQNDIMINPGDTRALNGLVLATGTANESITVATSTEYVAPEDSGERSALLTTKDIERLPLASRNASELLKILPGVTTTASGTGNGPGLRLHRHRLFGFNGGRGPEHKRRSLPGRHGLSAGRCQHHRSGLRLLVHRDGEPGHDAGSEGAVVELWRRLSTGTCGH